MFLYYIFITPIEKILEWIFYYFIKSNCSVFAAIFGVSIVMNLLALPLYRIADALQKKERDVVRRMEPMLKHIKQTFTGDERFMMISTYYRQNHYHPLYVIRSSLSILITVPFFIAGYHFLSHCPELVDQKFWFFKDLGSPDKIWVFKVFGLTLTINILPIIMTLVNVGSSAIYTKGGTFKEKLQVYALAFVFLILLYNSPAGLVIYWILNNIFSLVKNIFLETKNKKQIFNNIVKLMKNVITWCKKIICRFAVVCKNYFIKLGTIEYKSDFPIFFFSVIGLSLLLGFLLPASVISTSPVEFSFLGNTDSPFSYIFSSLCTFIGLCVVWPMCFYFMMGNRTKYFLSIICFTFLISAICNVYFFHPDYGNLDATFFLEKSKRQLIVPFYYSLLSLSVAVVAIVLFLVCRHFHKQKIVALLAVSLCIGMFGLGLYKSISISKDYAYYKNQKQNEGIIRSDNIEPIYHLSKDKQNVIVFFLDRALGFFVPYIMKEFPELEDQFDGFVFYPNTISHGRFTNTGSPAMLGGYEYTPDNMNARKDELLKDKHNEACLVAPKLFLDASFDITLTNVPWLNYEFESDYSVFDPYPGIEGCHTISKYWEYYYKYKKLNKSEHGQSIDVICKNRITYFSLTQALFPPLRNSFFYVSKGNLKEDKHTRTVFINNFSHLMALRDLTDFTNDKNTYIFLCNNTTHEYASLNVPGYDTVSETEEVDYHGYEPAFKSDVLDTNQGYQVNVATFLQLAKWLDYIKLNEAYDNTRIIFVADHGRWLKSLDKVFPKFRGGKPPTLPSSYNCLLMFKDFNSRGKLKTDNTFMTNADTLFLAKKDLPVSDINPFTGKKLEQDKENGVTIQWDASWNATEQKQNKTFPPPKETWFVKDNIFDPRNWKKIENKARK